MKNIKELGIINDEIDSTEKSIAFLQAKVKRWHQSGHDSRLPEFSFFDLAETEAQIFLHECSVKKLKSRFNIVLENLKY